MMKRSWHFLTATSSSSSTTTTSWVTIKAKLAKKAVAHKVLYNLQKAENNREKFTFHEKKNLQKNRPHSSALQIKTSFLFSSLWAVAVHMSS